MLSINIRILLKYMNRESKLVLIYMFLKIYNLELSFRGRFYGVLGIY